MAKGEDEIRPATPRRRDIVFVVDGDESARRNLRVLLGASDLDVETFSSAEDLLVRLGGEEPACLITEVHLPGMSGIELLSELKVRGVRFPVIALATHASVSLAVRALKEGAVDFIEKPLSDRRVAERVRTLLGLKEES